MMEMVKLQKQKAYTYRTEKGEKTHHFKHVIVIPEDVIQELGWKKGQDLSWTIASNKLVLSLSSTEESKNG